MRIGQKNTQILDSEPGCKAMPRQLSAQIDRYEKVDQRPARESNLYKLFESAKQRPVGHFLGDILDLLEGLGKLLGLVKNVSGPQASNEDDPKIDAFVKMAEGLTQQLSGCDDERSVDLILNQLDAEVWTAPVSKRVMLALAQVRAAARAIKTRLAGEAEKRGLEAVNERLRSKQDALVQKQASFEALNAAERAVGRDAYVRERGRAEAALVEEQEVGDAEAALFSERRQREEELLRLAQDNVAFAQKAAVAARIKSNLRQPSATSRMAPVPIGSRPAPTAVPRSFAGVDPAGLADFLGVVSKAFAELECADGKDVAPILRHNDRNDVLRRIVPSDLKRCHHVLQQALAQGQSFADVSVALLGLIGKDAA